MFLQICCAAVFFTSTTLMESHSWVTVPTSPLLHGGVVTMPLKKEVVSGQKFIITIHKLYRAHPCNQESQSGHKYKTKVLDNVGLRAKYHNWILESGCRHSRVLTSKYLDINWEITAAS